ncbi:MAG: hypothetical protein IPL36_04580 [Nigerium sp.]|nr:hypothetical protein [Nigerium sp.]
MRFYARSSWQTVGQVAADLAVIAWVAIWWWVGRATEDLLLRIARPVGEAGRVTAQLEGQLADAADQAARVPLVGDSLRRPFDDMAATVNAVATSVQQQAGTLEQTAPQVGGALFWVPVLLVVGFWALKRYQFMIRFRDTAALAVAPGGEDLLALRALATQRPARLRIVGVDPARAWRDRDPEALTALARLEMISAGLLPTFGPRADPALPTAVDPRSLP